MSSPVITKCQHSFCEGCALRFYQKDKRCFVCKAQTKGVFNTDKELSIKIKELSKEDYTNYGEEKS